MERNTKQVHQPTVTSPFSPLPNFFFRKKNACHPQMSVTPLFLAYVPLPEVYVSFKKVLQEQKRALSFKPYGKPFSPSE